ncbi:EF-hand domain-containing protein [Colwellia sp. C1TZA3]|nr:EF-hand domain-containing protein [Colwellia sp. C1TZA3]
MFDVNKDEKLNRSEFVELIDVLLQDKSIQMCQTIFNFFNKNNDNSIAKLELKDMLIDLAF